MTIANDYSTTGEILQDLKNGKAQPWRSKKVNNLMLSDSFKRLGNEKKSSRVKFCGYELVFDVSVETCRKYLKAANFCRCRLCPLCQWRRSIKIFNQLSRVVDVAEERHKNLVPIFLTLTVKNCAGDDLSATFDDVFRGWKNLVDHYRTRKIVKGWFRALEVTYDGDEYITQKRYNKSKGYYNSRGLKAGDKNPNFDSFHPHLHALLLVDKAYFKGKDYMQTVDWVRLWRTSAGLDYDPTCDIRKVKRNKGRHKDIAEVAKYTLKDADYITRDSDLMDKLVEVLDGALHRRRLYAYGGVLKTIAKELDAGEPGDGDLVHVGDDVIREDIAALVEVYRWSFGAANYLLRVVGSR